MLTFELMEGIWNYHKWHPQEPVGLPVLGRLLMVLELTVLVLVSKMWCWFCLGVGQHAVKYL